MEDEAPTMLYLAYGSNLSLRQMRARCPGARPVARAVLEGYALAFAGHSRGWGGPVATVVRARGARVHGLLYELPTEDLRALDRSEGAPFVYERRMRIVRDEHGRRRRAHLYVHREDQGDVLPPLRYVERIRRAYRRLGFPTSVLPRARDLRENDRCGS
jgi:cation transport regulator ChaC